MSEPIQSSGGLPSNVDVLVVGGGIAGVSLAHHLAGAGVETLLCERERVGSGATRTAVGVLSPPMRQPFHETAHFRGTDEALAIWRFAERSVLDLGAALEGLGAAEACELDLRGGTVLAEPHSEHEVTRAFEALRDAGLGVEWLDREQVRAETRGRSFTGGYRMRAGGSVDPLAAAGALGRGAAARGVQILEETAVLEVIREDGALRCVTDAGEVRAKVVVYATHIHGRRFSAFVGDEVVPIRGQAFRTEPVDPVFRGSFATEWKLNLWRQRPNGELVVGGWRHDAWDRSYYRSQPQLDDGLQGDLVAWFEAAFPELAPLGIAERWSGIFGWTADYLPLAGPLPGAPGEFVLAGFSGGGLPFAFRCAQAVTAMVTGAEPVEDHTLFLPRRFT